VRIVVEATRLPLPPGVDLQDALTGGEDHALVAVLPAATPLPLGVLRIGRVDPGEGVEVEGAPDGAAPGWRHFG
jgi:thiamine-monophosphate kinase